MSEFNAKKLNPDNINGGGKFNKGDGFSANDLNGIVEGILYSETQGGGNVDLTEYQKKTDTALETESKEIVGAINEINEKVGQGGSNIEVDNELNAESENAIANKVVTGALGKKLDKVNTTSTTARVYAVDTDGNQTIISADHLGATANAIARRDGYGCVKVAAPRADGDAINKKWFTDNFRTFYLHKLDFGNNIYLNILTTNSLAFTKEEIVDSATGTTYSYATKTNMDYVIRVQLEQMWVSDERQGLLREVYNPQITIGNGEGNFDTPLTNKGILHVSCDIFGEQAILNCGNFVGDTVSRYYI